MCIRYFIHAVQIKYTLMKSYTRPTPTMHTYFSQQSHPVTGTTVSFVTPAMKYSQSHESCWNCRERCVRLPCSQITLAKKCCCSLWSFAEPPDKTLSPPSMPSQFHTHLSLFCSNTLSVHAQLLMSPEHLLLMISGGVFTVCERCYVGEGYLVVKRQKKKKDHHPASAAVINLTLGF